MNVTAGLFAVLGALVGALGPFGLGLLNRRTERRRLARAEKIATYPAFVGAATRLAELPVWPADTDPREPCERLDALAQQIAFFGPRRVSQALGPVLVAARELSGTVLSIRAESRPGHRNQIDQRHAPRHRAAVAALANAIAEFGAAGRADLEIDGQYLPLITSRNYTDTLSNMSREPGAGSREPGAGSREPGAGSREPGVVRSLRVCHAR